MEEISFRCPAFLAQRFWLLCAERDVTPGAALRDFMVKEIQSSDAAFTYDLKAMTGLDEKSVRDGLPTKSPKAD